MIGLIDYGLGNLKSFSNILKNFNTAFIIPKDDNEIEKCSRYILPGVGSFDEAVKKLKSKNYFRSLEHEVIKKKKKILGICVGMQIFLKNSEEGDFPGLGWVNGLVKKFPINNLRVPHIGWNKIKIQKRNELLNNLEDPEFYFLHSYYCSMEDSKEIVAITNYSEDFCSCYVSENISGIQFHPEKSHDNGIKLLKNFINL